MTSRISRLLAVAAILSAGACSPSVDVAVDQSWQQEFDLSGCNMTSTGRNEFFILEPGFRLVLEGNNERLVISVLDETRSIDGVTARVVEEREWKNDALIEVSRNFFAICQETNDVFYFGEEVDDYRGGEIVGHGGAWLAGSDGAEAGLIMSGDPQIGMKYYQEIAPNAALDRAEVVSLVETLETPAGLFTNCLRTHEGTALNLNESEFKTYASGVGLIQEQSLLLTEYGFVSSS